MFLKLLSKFVKVSKLRSLLNDILSKYFSCLQLFDMKKFQSNVNRELRRAYPDRRRLETQCLSAIAFVKSEGDLLECPIWVLIINVVAMDMLKSKLPPGKNFYNYFSFKTISKLFKFLTIFWFLIGFSVNIGQNILHLHQF